MTRMRRLSRPLRPICFPEMSDPTYLHFPCTLPHILQNSLPYSGKLVWPHLSLLHICAVCIPDSLSWPHHLGQHVITTQFPHPLLVSEIFQGLSSGILSWRKGTKNTASIANAVQVTPWLSVTHPDFQFLNLSGLILLTSQASLTVRISWGTNRKGAESGLIIDRNALLEKGQIVFPYVRSNLLHTCATQLELDCLSHGSLSLRRR